MKAWQVFAVGVAVLVHGQIQSLRNATGLRLLIANRDNPALAIVLPGYTDSNRSIEVIFPEHATAKRHGSSEPEHLYLSNGRQQRRQTGNSLEYEHDLSGGIHFLARATLEDDGVLFRYEFLNRSNSA